MQAPDTKPGLYYVTAIRDDGRAAFLAGPFENDHARALELVGETRRVAERVDPRAFWYSYGTARLDVDTRTKTPPRGRLNKELGL